LAPLYCHGNEPECPRKPKQYPIGVGAISNSFHPRPKFDFGDKPKFGIVIVMPKCDLTIPSMVRPRLATDLSMFEIAAIEI
jgi:hypothetical protein